LKLPIIEWQISDCSTSNTLLLERWCKKLKIRPVIAVNDDLSGKLPLKVVVPIIDSKG